MKNDILLKYRMLNAEEVNREIFKDFIRYQNVTKCWRKENGKWIITHLFASYFSAAASSSFAPARSALFFP